MYEYAAQEWRLGLKGHGDSGQVTEIAGCRPGMLPSQLVEWLDSGAAQLA
jgi:hypothetical protein